MGDYPEAFMRRYDRFLVQFILTMGLSFFLSLPSMAQKVQEDANMERFDIERFNRNKHKYTWSYVLPDGTNVSEREDHGNGYQVEITAPHSAYTTIKLFNYEGGLIHFWLRFYNFTIGTSKSYDGRGNLLRVYNQDEGFAFSVDDLIKKMQDEYGVDITDTRQAFGVSRGIEDVAGQQLPVYDVYVYDFENMKKNQPPAVAYLFNGSTGELLYTVSADTDGAPDILDEYRKWLAKQKP